MDKGAGLCYHHPVRSRQRSAETVRSCERSAEMVRSFECPAETVRSRQRSAEKKEPGVRLKKQERARLRELSATYLKDARVQSMRRYRQHGRTDTLRHVKNVTRISFWLNRRLHLGADEPTLVTGALLHDFYLYDWHNKEEARYGLHGFVHPRVACGKARRAFDIPDAAAGVIRTHMWPLTLRDMPRSREAWIVCLTDKAVSLQETLWGRLAMQRERTGRPHRRNRRR